jgi:UDP-N-acetylglucosamine--N-acetylmuramyl-(pentapeptide) pyrophosphoryl-undecaprenol N-acetylglucosamine transferase
MKDQMRAVIAGGGTGGHLFPGIAVAKELEKRFDRPMIVFVVGRRPLEAEILAGYGYPSRPLDIEGLKGAGPLKAMKALYLIPKSIFQAWGLIREIRPLFVLGVGGYSSGPLCVAASIMGVPSAIHEQNSYPGLTNRMLAGRVDCVFASFEESLAHMRCKRASVTGNPVREELIFTDAAAKGVQSEGHEAQEMKPFTLLFMGGSQGAVAVNDAALEALKILKERKISVRAIHQTGKADFERMKQRYAEMGLNVEVSAFIRDMASAYREADLVVSRAGATTIFELAATGSPSILIPYPHAANNHQETNALGLVKAGAAEMILQRDLTGGLLADAVGRYVLDRERLRAMSKAAAGFARPHAARDIVDGLMELISA